MAPLVSYAGQVEVPKRTVMVAILEGIGKQSASDCCMFLELGGLHVNVWQHSTTSAPVRRLLVSTFATLHK